MTTAEPTNGRKPNGLDQPFLRRVGVRNYKSIESCDVALGALTVLVGRNGSGKSNFLDALRFVSDALRKSLDIAISDRGGVNEVRRRSTGHPKNFALELVVDLNEGRSAVYAFEIAARQRKNSRRVMALRIDA